MGWAASAIEKAVMPRLLQQRLVSGAVCVDIRHRPLVTGAVCVDVRHLRATRARERESEPGRPKKRRSPTAGREGEKRFLSRKEFPRKNS